MRGVVLVAACLCSLMAACYPIPVKSECQARVSECLRDCPMAPPARENEYNGVISRDMRSDCERRCHELCADRLF